MPALREYGDKLFSFGMQVKNIACISTDIEVDLARLDLCPMGHADHTSVLSDLAHGFELCYIQGGNISDLNRALEIRQTTLDLCPLGHPGHADAIGDLVVTLQRYYYIQANKADLDRIIEMEQRWLDVCPSGHIDHGRALGHLAVSLYEYYLSQGDIADLNKAVNIGEKWLNLCSTDAYDTALGNLGNSLLVCYQKQGNLTDLDRAIELREKCLELCPFNHPLHGQALQNLAIALQDCCSRRKNHSDLTKAIKLLKEALDTNPVQHYQFALTVQQLAESILLSFKILQKYQHLDQLLPLQEEAFDTYRLLKRCGPAVSMDLWHAIQAWIKSAEKYNHSSVLEAYQTSLNTLDHFTSLNSSLGSRHEAMQPRVADLANNAFSCAIRHGGFRAAVQLLEQGRGILWNQLARFDASIAALENRGDRGSALASKFTRLSADLRRHAQESRDKGMAPYWRVQEEWRSVVDRIRCLDGFSRFLLPPQFDDLQRAAGRGPIIIVNASKYTCDALIVLHTRLPVHVALPCSFSDVTQLCSQLSELTQDPDAYGKNREPWVKQMLRELWSSVVEPIAAALQNDIQLPAGSHIWWCPTSKFTILPFHAAGPYRKTQKSVLDIYVSSYAPSLSALVRARERARAQKVARNVSGSEDMISFAAIGQRKPSADSKLPELPEVEFEIERIRNETGMPPEVKFETITGAAATIEGAVQAFRDHRCVHLACHGAQHAKKPFESWFAMGDGKLTLMRIIQERYSNSDFAFLSACHTALGDESTPDEVLHLAAGMQFAGFNGVIGTLWRVDDSVAHQVVTRFYQEMFKQPVVDFEYAATALNTAVLETAEDVSLEKRIVFVHIGI